ncbi:MAG: Penicillin-binding protein 2 [Acidobacteriaceae bacterium]|nr:Penicillin-binding protein 2 [Acidobacteriaceae bacterium]
MMREEKTPALKLAVVQYAIVAILAILITGLWRLQILGATNYRELAEANRVRKVPILAPRGRLFDREGRLLVDNYPSVSCFLVPDQTQSIDADLPKIARGLHMTEDQVRAVLVRYRSAPKYQPLPLKSDITPDEKEFIEAHRDELPELETIDVQRRLYPRDGFAANLIGYTGEVSEDMLNQSKYAYYEPGDVVGRSGVEESYDAMLRGTDGSRDVLVDSHGREVGRLGFEHAIPGKDLKLTIDIDIQRAAEQALGNKNGAVIAIDPHTGEVLAMVSRPAFDPNDFAVHISRDTWAKLITDPNHPLLNKAIQAQLAPGSTFKIIMSVAGMQEGVAQTLHVNCPGGGTFYGRFFKCWLHGGHGGVELTKGIYQSCDTYFYTLAERLGIEKIAKWAHALGLGQRTGIDLPNEVAGVMPSEEWKMKTFHEKWYAGEVISVGIGQGAVAATPVQMARAIAGIASGGVLKRPHVVMQDQLPPTYRQAMVDSYPGSGDSTFPLSAEAWQKITDAMFEVTQPEGTSPSAHLDGVDFAGKTGSAQVVSNEFKGRMGGGASMKDNAWFVGVTPRRNPEIVVCTLFEGGEHGRLAGRLAAQIIGAYVNKQRRLENNLLPLAAPKPATPAGQPTAEAPPKAGGKPVEVGAIWSNPAAPDALGGRRVKPIRAQDAKALAAVRGGHFFLSDAAARTAGGTR